MTAMLEAKVFYLLPYMLSSMSILLALRASQLFHKRDKFGKLPAPHNYYHYHLDNPFK